MTTEEPIRKSRVRVGGMMAGMGLWMLLVTVTVLAVLVAAVLAGVWLFRRWRDHAAEPRAVDPDRARELLRQRYASGEIDDEEFERRLAALSWR